MNCYLNNSNEYIVVYFSGERFEDDITLLTVDAFYSALKSGLFKHSLYVGIGTDTLEEAKILYKEIYADKHFGEEIEDKYINIITR